MAGITSDIDLEELANRMGLKLNYIGFKNELPQVPHKGSYIINLASSDDGTGGTHWVALRLDKYGAIYFDPFGMPEPIAVNKFIMKWVKNNENKVIRNTTDIQSITSNWCGQYSVAALATFDQKKNQSLSKRLNNFISEFRHY